MAKQSAPRAQGIEVQLSGTFPRVPRSVRSVHYHGARYVLADNREDVEAAAKLLAKGVKGHAEKLLRKAVIQVKGKPKLADSGEGDEKNGIELNFDLAMGNFAGLGARLFIDYLLKGLNAQGEPASWWEALVSKVQGDKPIESGGQQYDLHQMVFKFCKGNHASTPDRSPKIGQMLETIGFLQGAGDLVVVKPNREEGQELPKGGKEEDAAAEEKVAKAAFALFKYFAGKEMGTGPTVKKFPADDKWNDVAVWQDLFTSAKLIPKPLTQEMADGIVDFVKKYGSRANFKKILTDMATKPKTPELMKGPGGIREVFKTKLATIINQGPYRINYMAWDQMDISGDQEGNTILKIKAPMKPYFTFKKSQGGPPVLVDASCLLCGRVFASKPGDEAAAGRLAWTGVILGRGAALGINPVETTSMDEAAWLEKLKNDLPKVEEQPGTTPTPVPPPGGGAAPLPPPAAPPPPPPPGP
jgi:hypothetical protein